MMTAERGMAALAAGGSVLAQFDTILAAAVPEFAGRVRAVAFDADTGRLDVWSAGRATGGCRRCRPACAGRGQGLSTTSGEDSVGSFCAGHVARVFFIAVPSAGVTQRWYFCFTTIWRAT